MTKRVAVIGAGLAGLPVIRYLTASSSPSSSSSSDVSVEVVGFEREGVVGGNWVYTEKTGIDVDGLPVHCSMYKHLRSNGPKDTNRYLDFPYKEQFPSFTGHDEIQEYLESFADHFNLQQNIRFNTLVTKVTPLTPDIRDTRWEVTYCNRFDQSNTTREEFDYVVVCNGHSNAPYLPTIPGLASFTGQIVHSRDYRLPDKFKDQVVVCVGAGPSGVDISIDIAKTATRVFISKTNMGKSGNQIEFPENIAVKPGIKKIKENSVVFTNEDEEQCDAIVLCTGYVFNFPFLTKECRIILEDDGKRVTPLYKHIVHVHHQSMLFVGIPDFCATFNVYDIQARFVAKLIQGGITLIDKAVMMKDTENEMEKKLSVAGMKSSRFHKLGPTGQSNYMDSLLDLMGEPHLPKGYGLLFGKAVQLLFSKPATYRDDNYEIDGDTFHLVKAE